MLPRQFPPVTRAGIFFSPYIVKTRTMNACLDILLGSKLPKWRSRTASPAATSRSATGRSTPPWPRTPAYAGPSYARSTPSSPSNSSPPLPSPPPSSASTPSPISSSPPPSALLSTSASSFSLLSVFLFFFPEFSMPVEHFLINEI